MTFPHAEDLIQSEPESDVRDPFKTYLHEISKHPLMTREEERNGSKGANGRGQRGKREIVLGNLRLVVKIALEYHSHLNLLDLIQEGKRRAGARRREIRSRKGDKVLNLCILLDTRLHVEISYGHVEHD